MRARRQAPGPGWVLVAKLRAAAVDVILQLSADRLVHGRRLVLVEGLRADLAGARGGVLAALLQPALVVRGRGQQRPVEAFPEPLHRVRGAQEVAPVADLLVRAERERGLVDLQRRELD